jgi:Flp pilus assembly protein TadG
MHYKTNRAERGASLMEFAIGATVFLTVLFAVIECGRLLFTHNSLQDAARRGARYAGLRRPGTDDLAVKRMVVYGNPNGTGTPVVSGLTTNDVQVYYNQPNGLQLGSRATITITNTSTGNYKFKFAVPLVGGTITLHSYKTTMAAESLGYVPCDIAAGISPLAECYYPPS